MEIAIAYFKVLYQHLDRSIDKSHEKPQNSWYLAGDSNLGLPECEGGIQTVQPRHFVHILRSTITYFVLRHEPFAY